MYFNELLFSTANEDLSFKSIKDQFCYEKNDMEMGESILSKTITQFLLLLSDQNANYKSIFYNESKESNIDKLIVSIDDKIIELSAEEEYENNKSIHSIEYYQWKSIMPTNENSLNYIIRFFKAVIIDITKNNTLDFGFLEKYFFGIDFPPEFEKNIIILKNILDILKTDNIDVAKLKFLALENRIKFILKNDYDSKHVYDVQDLYIIYWYTQILLFITVVKYAVPNSLPFQSFNKKEGVYYLSNLFSNICRNDNAYSDGIAFSQIAKKSSIPSIKMDSYNLLGLCAIESGNKQLAYDAYYSWINRESTDSIEYFVFQNTPNDIDIKWRKTDQGKKQEAIMRNNFSYVCSEIYGTVERNDIRWNIFYNISKEQILIAQELDPRNESFYCTGGAILYEGEEYEESLKQFQKYKSLSKNKSDIICALQNFVDIDLSLLVKYILKNGLNFGREFLEYYFSYVHDIEEYFNSICAEDKTVFIDEYETWKSYSYLFDLHNLCTNGYINSKTEYLLIIISELCNRIENSLSRNEYGYYKYLSREKNNDKRILQQKTKVNPIAYYTSLDTAQYLFSPSNNEYDDTINSHEQKNCFTIMHSKYMNDPNEGMTLLNSLFESTQFKSVEFKQEINKNSFVFLKSFTENIDSLIMWNRYGRNSGGDGDGCCLVIDPITFDKIVNPTGNDKNLIKQFEKNNDYFNLYRIVYVTKDGDIDKEKNAGLAKNTIDSYNLLKKLLTEINKTSSDEIIKKISPFLQHCFRFIIFLFKNDDYSHEKESRIIIRRTLDDLKSIRTVSNNPPKLCIKPFFQVFIKEVIFGPNCNDIEKWEPYFQFGLAEMWKEECENSNGLMLKKDLPYIIKQSDIKYKP